jgi:hypothetical protein
VVGDRGVPFWCSAAPHGSRTDADANSGRESDAPHTHGDRDADANADGNADATGTHTDSDTHANPNGDSGTAGTHANHDTNTNTNRHPDVAPGHADCDTDADPDSHADRDTNTNTNTDGHPDVAPGHADCDTDADPDSHADHTPAHTNCDTPADPNDHSDGDWNADTDARPEWPGGLVHLLTGDADRRTADTVHRGIYRGFNLGLGLWGRQALFEARSHIYVRGWRHLHRGPLGGQRG